MSHHIPEFALFIFDFTKFLLYCKRVKKTDLNKFREIARHN